ncbi:hypothetical protein, partial [Roseiflexus sp.]|uniref:hypothetical protein n=1 Tax=Roseiflexus sp. TaxID=2562120 RepID=UPI00398AB21E
MGWVMVIGNPPLSSSRLTAQALQFGFDGAQARLRLRPRSGFLADVCSNVLVRLSRRVECQEVNSHPG